MEMVVEGQNQPKMAPKRIKVQQIAENGEEDRFSALPDCLLLEILSRLPYETTKGAIRTGTLSKRWKNIWTLLPILSFVHYRDNHPWSHFVWFVGKTLSQCRQLKLKKFQVSTDHYSGFESQVNNWIRYAIRCNVEELDLILGNEDFKAKFLLYQIFFISSCFIRMRLQGCIFIPIGEVNWTNLRRLCISCGKLDENSIEKILSGSPVLETLVLYSCYGYRLLDITSKSVKNLVFSGYNNIDDEYEDLDDVIEINAPNILSLTIRGTLMLWKLLLLNMSSLVEANLDYLKFGHYATTRKEGKQEMLKGLILNLCHVKELKIGVLCSGVLFRLEAKGFDFPSNMIMNFGDGYYDSDSDSEEGGD